MFVLYQQENNKEFYICGKLETKKGKKSRIAPEFSSNLSDAIKFKDDIDIYEYFGSETRGKQILKSYSKKELGEEYV